MALGFIGVGIGAILMAIGITALLIPKVRAFLKIVPFFKPQMVAIILLVVGIVAGGFGWYQGKIDVATIGGVRDQGAVVSAVDQPIEKCVYTGGTSVNTNATVRQDPNSNNRVFVDVDESVFLATGGSAASEIAVNFSIVRSGSVHEDATVHIVVRGAKFTSEVSTTDSNTYNILETSARPSVVWNGDYEATIYVDEDIASTSDTEEEVYMTFAESEKTLNLALLGEIDSTSYSAIRNYTQKDVIISQRINGADTPICYVSVLKVP